MAHLLFLSGWWPYPANNGSKIRVYNLLRNLAQHHRITLLSFADSGEATPENFAHLRSFCAQVEAFPKPVYRPGALKATLGYLSPWPRSLVDVYSPAMAERVRTLVRQDRPEVVIASQFQTMRYLELVSGIPAILEEPEITVFHNQVAQASNRASRFRAQLTLTKLENALRRLLNRGVAFTVVSELEKTHMRQFAPPDAIIEVIPNGVDTIANRPDAAILPEPYTLIYPGAITYSANEDAVRYFIHKMLPLVRKRIPQTRFSVTGSTGTVDVSELASSPGVVFTGYLPSVAAAVQASWGVVVPLRLGGGTRLKILEAMALGTPVVSTTKGAEGLNVHPGHDIMIADEPETMTEAIVTLLDDADLRARLSQAGRRLVEQEYDWGIIAGKLVQLIDCLLAR